VLVAAALSACGTEDVVPTAPSHGVAIESSGCGPVPRRAAGTIVGPALVLTAAHPVVGAERIVIDHQGQVVDATIATADTVLDLAVLHAPGLDAAPLDRETLPTGSHGTYQAGDDELVPFSVTRQVDIAFADIYGDGSATRPGYELEAAVTPGHSGAGLVVDGRLGGVVFAASTRGDDRGWATDIRAAEQLLAGDVDSPAFELRCAP